MCLVKSAAMKLNNPLMESNLLMRTLRKNRFPLKNIRSGSVVALRRFYIAEDWSVELGFLAIIVGNAYNSRVHWTASLFLSNYNRFNENSLTFTIGHDIFKFCA